MAGPMVECVCIASSIGGAQGMDVGPTPGTGGNRRVHAAPTSAGGHGIPACDTHMLWQVG